MTNHSGNNNWLGPRTACSNQIGRWISAFIYFVLCLASTSPSVCQEYSLLNDSTVIGQTRGLPSAIEFNNTRNIGDVSLVVESLFYAKNLELTGSPNIDGETFIGSINPIRFNYLASDQVQIELGGYFGSNYGDDDSLDISEPLARLIFQPLPDQFLIAGSLIQSHWMHDALRDDVNIYRNPVETGLQHRVSLPWLKSDSWIDWRVRETATRSEQFEGASANQIRWGRVWIDGQFLWSHVGGQQNSMSQIINNSTGMLGMSVGIVTDIDGEYIGRIGASFLATNFESRTAPTMSGQGVEYWTSIDVLTSSIHQLRLFGKHFDGDQVFALRGDPLYQFDQYSQLGFNWISSVNGNLQLELGFVGQYADDTLMNTYQINFVWQNRFHWFNKCCEASSLDSRYGIMEDQ